MKAWLKLRAISAAIALAIGTLAAQTSKQPATASANFPVVTMDYSELLDSACATSANRPLDSDLVARVAAKLPQYRTQWASRGPALLRAEAEIVGHPFAYHETWAAIVTCGLPSMSFPLVLNARSFLGAFDETGSEAGEMTSFVNTLWHEASHRYVHDLRDRFPDRMTPLLKKYSSEPAVVLSHLHLYAIEQLIYRRLGLEPDLELVRKVQKKMRNQAVTDRAREIVAKEGADAFVRELKAAPATH
jgi:hypothetical protein